ncbi:hypothetical protein DP56_5984 [Burkholderia pseudomallei]|nr:hypothetical protein DP56_5984 [Burkholderia pseudomallei]
MRGDERGEQRAPPFERHAAQVEAVQERHVEQEQRDIVRASGAERVLQRLEIRHARAIEHDRLAVEPAPVGRQARERVELRGEFRAPVEPLARVNGNRAGRRAAIDPDQHAVAVELRFV